MLYNSAIGGKSHIIVTLLTLSLSYILKIFSMAHRVQPSNIFTELLDNGIASFAYIINGKQ